MADIQLGNAPLVNKYLGFLTEKYDMEFCAQKIPDAVGIENPSYVYSYHNATGCISILEIAQRNEWDLYYADRFVDNPKLRLQNRLKQTDYISKSVFSKRKFLKLLAKNIQNQIVDNGSFAGVKISSSSIAHSTGDDSA